MKTSGHVVKLGPHPMKYENGTQRHIWPLYVGALSIKPLHTAAVGALYLKKIIVVITFYKLAPIIIILGKVL